MDHRTAPFAAALAAAALALTACTGAPSTAPGTASSTAPSTGPSTATSTAPSAGDAGSAGTALIAMLGTPDDPDAFEIQLTDESGSPVDALPAGDYSLTFADRSSIHNVRLTGPGGVDVSTDVAGTDETTVEITLVAGTYTIVCDPHPSTMRDELEVSG